MPLTAASNRVRLHYSAYQEDKWSPSLQTEVREAARRRSDIDRVVEEKKIGSGLLADSPGLGELLA